jgi:hypothetical protein
MTMHSFDGASFCVREEPSLRHFPSDVRNPDTARYALATKGVAFISAAVDEFLFRYSLLQLSNPQLRARPHEFAASVGR